MNIRAGFLYTVGKYGDLPTLDNIKMALSELRKIGFPCCELEGRTKSHLRMLEENKGSLRDHCEGLGIKVINFVMMLPGTSSLNPDEQKDAVEQFRDASKLAKFFGCETMEMDSYSAALTYSCDPMETTNLKTKVPQGYSWDFQWKSFVNNVDEYAKVAADVGCKLQLHPRIGELVCNTDSMLRLRDAVKNENLGFIFDTAQLHAQKEILPLSAIKLQGYIRCLHLSDNDGNAHLHKRLGQGTIDWDGIIAVLRQHLFEWNIAVDIANFGEIEEDYIASLEFINNKLIG